jgi:hypothetical protein
MSNENSQGNSLFYFYFKFVLICFSIFVPLFIIDCPTILTGIIVFVFWLPTITKSPIHFFVMHYIYGIVRPILYVWALVCAINRDQDFFTIAFYIIATLQIWSILKNLFFIIVSLFRAKK